MNIAVLTLTRDRLAYTEHCFQTLLDKAGCDFDWYVLDQGSSDDTPEWLLAHGGIEVVLQHENIGICRGLNRLLDEEVNAGLYDVIVRFDNDCEVLQPNTLRILAELAYDHDAILAPRVLGLRNPPPILASTSIGDYSLGLTTHLGGIFMVIPASLFSDLAFRFDESNPPWLGDEQICPWWRGQGGRCGYVEQFAVNHYLTTDGQESDETMQAYIARKHQELTRR